MVFIDIYYQLDITSKQKASQQVCATKERRTYHGEKRNTDFTG